MQVKHSFDPKIAKKYGLEEAIIIENIKFWIESEDAFSDEKIWYDGKLWLKLTGKQLHVYFKYLHESSIRRKLYHLIEENVLEKGNFNTLPSDRSLWYTLSKNCNRIIQNE